MSGTAFRVVLRRSYFAMRMRCLAVRSTLVVRPEDRAEERSEMEASRMERGYKHVSLAEVTRKRSAQMLEKKTNLG
jgi:hypothetical protein